LDKSVDFLSLLAFIKVSVAGKFGTSYYIEEEEKIK